MIGIQAGDIVSLSGPFPCSLWPDSEIFKLTASNLDTFERVEADKGFSCLDPILTNNHLTLLTLMRFTVRCKMQLGQSKRQSISV